MTLTWLHVSDFHFRDSDPYDRDLVLRSLVKAVERFGRNGRRPDLVFATGDVAFSGKAGEYKLATRFFDDLINAASLQRCRLFVVPGNHDVDRPRGTGLARTLQSREEADTYFGPYTPLHHFSKQDAFVAWYNRYFEDIRSFPRKSTCGPVETVDVRGVKIGVLPINTGLFCQDENDHEKLWVGRRCLDAAMEELQRINASITMAIFHHPLDWLHPIERSNIRRKLLQRVDFLLRGHLHETEVEIMGAAPDLAMCLAAGPAYDSRKWPNRALYCTIDQQRVSVFPIRYEDQPEEVWTVDTSVFPRSENYERSFPLPRHSATGSAMSTEQVIIAELESARGLLSGSEMRRLAEQLVPVLADAELRAAQCMNVYQQTAMGASHLARTLPDDPASQLLFRRVCERLLANHGVELVIPLAQVNELYSLARSDDPDGPDNVLDWIISHARPAE
jgi:3',5'-cyclic AMP phosphodiesterase CpdA